MPDAASARCWDWRTRSALLFRRPHGRAAVMRFKIQLFAALLLAACGGPDSYIGKWQTDGETLQLLKDGKVFIDSQSGPSLPNCVRNRTDREPLVFFSLMPLSRLSCELISLASAAPPVPLSRGRTAIYRLRYLGSVRRCENNASISGSTVAAPAASSRSSVNPPERSAMAATPHFAAASTS